MDKISVFLVDDHEIFRNGLKQLINSEADMEVSGEASTGEDALHSLSNVQPDVVIMDIRMPGINGLETSAALLKASPRTHILFFSLFDEPDYVAAALEMGASGYILKDTSNKIFLNAIRTIHNGKYYFIGEVSDVLVKKYQAARESAANPVAQAADVSLSRREEQIIRMVNNGLNNKDIAESLGLSIRTIEAHRMNILRKFQVNSIEEVIEYCRNVNLLKEE
ncbi:response regulator transcription factor [Chitinophaga sancti]|uniref:Response regulator transcription factor n=1 Tax=Chitinophaga sancti TaxID=1004 RepID=A0A1K1R2L2_9BACT|nr:response regulator transcription factor [Chitinophaga sancti]WQD64340.1 response regulator transcription factor [Chitinophaga sancti]WQG90036.1 response regulator transcription factor [Chitinophaga sancti]SFW66261.1 two component transcriptional regulator, LuxR family [Chitinophaga sancti]